MHNDMYLEIMKKVTSHQELTYDEIHEFIVYVRDGNVCDVQIAGFLGAFLTKGYTSNEVASIAKALRNNCEPLRPQVDDDLMDTCGTGGGLSTFNISTATAIIASAAGIRVAKSGSRAITSSTGTADVLEALGVVIELHPDDAKRMIEEFGIAFLYGPQYHPLMAKVMPVEKNLKVKTLFYTIIGPLVNPALANRHLLGVCNENMMEVVTLAGKELGFKNMMCVHGVDGLDEISLLGKTRISHLVNGKISTYEIAPEDFGLARCTLDAIKSGNPTENAELIKSVFNGTNRSAARDAIVLNTAGSLIVGGKATDFTEGIALAIDILDSGAAYRKLLELGEMSRSLRRIA